MHNSSNAIPKSTPAEKSKTLKTTNIFPINMSLDYI